MHGSNATSQIAFSRLAGTRIVAAPAALDLAEYVPDNIVLRLAPDEIFAAPPLAEEQIAHILTSDPHAIVIADGGFSGVWIDEQQARRLLEQLADWEMPPPSPEPAFVQGAVGGIATKLYFADGRVLFLVQTPYALELEERLT